MSQREYVSFRSFPTTYVFQVPLSRMLNLYHNANRRNPFKDRAGVGSISHIDDDFAFVLQKAFDGLHKSKD